MFAHGALVGPVPAADAAVLGNLLEPPVQTHPDHFWKLLDLGLAYHRSGRAADAAAVLARAADAPRPLGDTRPLAWRPLAIAHRTAGDSAGADEAARLLTDWLREARRTSPDGARPPAGMKGWYWLRVRLAAREALGPEFDRLFAQ